MNSVMKSVGGIRRLGNISTGGFIQKGGDPKRILGHLKGQGGKSRFENTSGKKPKGGREGETRRLERECVLRRKGGGPHSIRKETRKKYLL